MFIRDVLVSDFSSILALNEESVQFLSPLNPQRLEHLHLQSVYHRVIEDAGEVQAFLMVFAQQADYDSENYRWFCERYSGFLYVDRIVVSNAAQGKGYGQLLYNDLFEVAKTLSVNTITCEYNAEPLNIISEKFHSRNGFHEVGTLWSNDGKKCVSMQEKLLV
jgi:uncharacterized protein